MTNPYQAYQATTPEIHEAAIRIARRCRYIVQACLREEEWGLADQEFYAVARQELETLKAAGTTPADIKI